MISVIIPTYNTALLIERTIRSVLAQSRQDFEVLIVDDCSADDTLDVVRKIADTRIRVFRQPENRGPAAARNRGLAEARGEYCAFLDGDDYWEPDFLKATADFLDAHPDAVAVFTGQMHNSASGSGSIRPRCLREGKGVDAPPAVLADFFGFWKDQKYLVCTGSIMMRAEALRAVGGQREDLRICEDLELWCMLGLRGRIGFVPQVLFVSDGYQGQGRRLRTYRKLMARWRGAPTVENWSQRHQALASGSENYRYIRGEVALDLIYAYMMRGDYGLARRTVQCYRDFLPLSRLTGVYCRFAGQPLLWLLLGMGLRIRSFVRLAVIGR